jgi:nicotinate-nucleotide adenylyltransferase
MKIALFGTSADPPTAAHQAILEWLAQAYDQVAVWASDNPFKVHQSPLADRLAMLTLLVQSLGHRHLQVWPELSDRRSLLSLQRAQALWGPQQDYSLVIGSDLIQQIHQWYQAPQLLAAVTLVIFPRPGYPIEPADLAALTQRGGRYCLVPTEAPAVSSTHYRQTQDQTLIPEPVKDYIQRHHLYLPLAVVTPDQRP